MKMNALIAGTVTAVGTLSSYQSYAATADQSAGQLEEVVVTAERREATVQKTAISITAISGDSLATSGITTADGLSNVVPSLHITTDPGGATTIAIRGLVGTQVDEEGDPAVAFNMNGVYLARAQSYSAALFDVDRVEVLRGPQGTLYGRNSAAGIVNVITKSPTDKFEGDGSVEYGNFNAITSSGAINVPLSDTFSMRAAVQNQRHDGYANNAPSHANGYDADVNALRLSTLWKPTDTFKWLLIADYQHQGGTAGGFRGGGTPLPLNPDPWSYPLKLDGRMDHRDYGLTSQMDWNLGFANLTYLAAARRETQDDLLQRARDGLVFHGIFTQKEMSHELRLGNSKGPLKWVLGAYYFHELNTADLIIPLPPVSPLVGEPTTEFNSNFVLIYHEPQSPATSRAGFGQLTYSVTDRVRLTGGLRYTSDFKANQGGHTILRFPLTGAPDIIASVDNEEARSTNTSYKVGVDFDVTPTSMAYATLTTGYKAGGYFPANPGNPDTYKPEKVRSIELGSKNRFANNRVQVNADIFDYDYTDFQATGVDLVNGVANSVTLNAGRAHVYGLELETIFQISANDRLALDGDYLHGRFGTFYLPLGDSYSNATLSPTPTCVANPADPSCFHPVDYTGNKLPHSPEINFTGTYSHTWDLSSGASLTALGQVHYESAQALEYTNFALTNQDAFTRSNASLTYSGLNGKWSVQAYIRNIENKTVLTGAFSNPGPASNVVINGDGTLAPPRTFGFRLSAKF
jgi:iron complex outermembrane recepter protein